MRATLRKYVSWTPFYCQEWTLFGNSLAHDGAPSSRKFKAFVNKKDVSI